jgi:hypothetical protein
MTNNMHIYRHLCIGTRTTLTRHIRLHVVVKVDGKGKLRYLEWDIYYGACRARTKELISSILKVLLPLATMARRANHSAILLLQ